jgi:hypothetical protein
LKITKVEIKQTQNVFSILSRFVFKFMLLQNKTTGCARKRKNKQTRKDRYYVALKVCLLSLFFLSSPQHRTQEVLIMLLFSLMVDNKRVNKQ